MKYCNNCHRLSKDDDFCSHCGCAVYGNDDNYSENISCESIDKNHSHEKVTYTSAYSNHKNTKNGTARQNYGSANSKNQKNGSCLIAIIILFIVASFLIEIINEFASYLE